MTPLVSVVIPTRNRPELVTRAARSALSQTVTEIEVVVVVDGPDPGSRAALAGIGDDRLRVVELPTSGGAPNARNTGVRHARGHWTALLDDDDEWLPDKLASQLTAAERATAEQASAGRATVTGPIVTTRLLMRTPRADLVLPRRLPDPGEPTCEYLTVRRGLFHGDGFIQTSTILAPTELLRRVPFTVGLPRCQELDWALRALRYDGVELVIVPEPMVVWHADENRARISSTAPWRRMLDWLADSRPRLTRRAYAALAMSVIGSIVATTRSPRQFVALLRHARRYGDPHLIDYLTYLQVWLLPPNLRRRLRDLLKGRRARSDAPTGQPLPAAAQDGSTAAAPARQYA